MQIKRILPKLLITLAVLLYAVILYISPISCIFNEIFGIPCPGCGMTRALLSVLRFDFNKAFSYHFMFWSLPILYLCFLKDGKLFKRKHLNTCFFILIIIGFIINWVYRIFVGF